MQQGSAPAVSAAVQLARILKVFAFYTTVHAANHEQMLHFWTDDIQQTQVATVVN